MNFWPYGFLKLSVELLFDSIRSIIASPCDLVKVPLDLIFLVLVTNNAYYLNLLWRFNFTNFCFIELSVMK